MASRKEYEMLFALNASLNGNFQGTFSKAQQEFSKLGREIQELQKLQANVSSYQKQEQAIASTAAKLTSLQQQHGLLQKEIGETTGSTAALEREKLKLEQRINDTETALERQKQKLDATSQKLQEAGVDTNNLAQADARLTGQIKELQAQQDQAADSAASFGQRAAQGIQAVQNAIMASGIAEALGAVKDAYLECVSVAADFEEDMSGVEAISGATPQEMAQLAAKAKELRAETKFTAREASGAMGYMAMAGWKAGDMLGGLEGVMNLAAASGEDLAAVSDIVTDALTAFGLKASDSGRFADILAVAASNANTNVGMMGDTFKYVAPVAGALGYSAEDAAVAIGLMANSGIKASQAGTALRSIITRLSTDAGASSTQLGALGVLTEELGVAFYNADGSARELNEVLADSRAAWAGLSEEQQINYGKVIAGQEAMSGWLALMNASGADIQKLTGSVNDCSGAAARMAAIKLDNLNGQLTLMNSAWEAVQTTIGEQFNPELRELAETGTDVLGWVNGFIQENPALVKGVITFTGVLGGAAVAITGVSAAIGVLKALNVSLFAGPAGAVLALAGGVAVLAGATVSALEAQKDLLDESWQLTASSRDQYNRLQELNTEYERTVEQFGETSYEAQSLKWQMDDLAAEYDAGRQTMEEYRAAHEAAMESYRDMAAAREAASSGLDTEAAGTEALIGKLAELTATSARAAENQDAIRSIVDHLNETLPDLNLNYGSVIVGSGAFIDSLYEMAKAEADAKNMAADYEEYVDRLAKQGELKAHQQDLTEQVRLAQAELDAAQKNYSELAQGMDPFNPSNSSKLNEAILPMNAARSQLEFYTAALEEATAACEENEAAISELEGAFRDYQAAQQEAADAAPTLEGTIASVRGQLQQLAAAYGEAYTAAEESISGQYSLWDQAAEIAATSASSINAALESQISYWQDYNANLQALGERSTEIAGLSDMIASFADGSAESVNAIAGMASASDEDLRAMVSKWQELQEQQSQTAGSMAELVSGFPEQMEQLVTAMEEGVEGMSLPEEAQNSARNTIQAFIDQAQAMLPVVQDAYALLGQTAADALGLSRVRSGGGGYGAGSGGSVSAFASGTGNAPPGWAWVGEEGPELIHMGGGEAVLPADVSREFAALSAYSGDMAAYAQATAATAATPVVAAAATPSVDGPPITVELHFHIDAGASPQAVDALRDYVDSGSFEERVKRVVSQAAADARRRDGF